MIKVTKTNSNSDIRQRGETAIEPADAIKILVVAGQPIVCAGLVAMLEEQPDFNVVGTGANCAQCCRMASKLNPDVLVCDLETDVKCNAECLSDLLDAMPKLPTIVIHKHAQERRVMGASRLGVQGYLTLDSEPETLFRAIRVVTQGGIFIDRGLYSTFLNISGETNNTNLGNREHEILLLIAEGKTNQEIAKTILISESTVKHYISEMYSKLGVSNRAEAVKVAMNKGII